MTASSDHTPCDYRSGLSVVLTVGLALLLTGCERGPTEEDMRGCAVRGGGPSITSREVADCAVDRAARHEGEVK